MERAKNVLFKVATILSIFSFVLYMLIGIGCANIGLYVLDINSTPEELLAIKNMYLVCAGIFIFFSINCFINFFICLFARKKNQKDYILQV